MDSSQYSHLQQSYVMSPLDSQAVFLADPEMCACLAMIDPSLSVCGCVLSATMTLMACSQNPRTHTEQPLLSYICIAAGFPRMSKHVQSKDLDAEEMLVCGEMEQNVQIYTVVQLACSDSPGFPNMARQQPCSTSAIDALPLSATMSVSGRTAWPAAAGCGARRFLPGMWHQTP